MSNTAPGAKAPALFWIVTGLSLLWNGFGACDYAMTKLHNAWWLSSMAVDPAMIAKVDAAPVWGTFGWAVGVWGSLLGAVLMLLRSRHAASAYLASLIGAAVGFSWQIKAGLFPGPAFPAVILAVIIALWWYCRRCTASGILK